MQQVVLNRATMRVADTTEVSGRVTADLIKHELYAKKQSSLWRSTIFGFCKVCSLVAATLILPALAYAQNNQGDDQGNGGRGIPNGTYVFNITGYFPTGAFVAAVVRTTYTPNKTGSGGTTSSVASYAIFGGPLYTGVTVTGTFTVNKDGSLTETYTQTSSPFQTLHFISYPTPDANTITILETDPGAVTSGVGTRGR